MQKPEAPTPQQVSDAAFACGHELDSSTSERLAAFFGLLLTWNQRINLTGARSGAELLREHLPDALAVSRVARPHSHLLDIGAGGGLPGIPLGILRPDVHLTLVEPRSKRTAFLRAAARAGGLSSVAVRDGRLEAVPDAAAELAYSRATFPPHEWVRLGRRVVVPGGQLLAFVSDAKIAQDLADQGSGNASEYLAGSQHRWLVVLPAL